VHYNLKISIVAGIASWSWAYGLHLISACAVYYSSAILSALALQAKFQSLYTLASTPNLWNDTIYTGSCWH